MSCTVAKVSKFCVDSMSESTALKTVQPCSLVCPVTLLLIVELKIAAGR